MAGYILHKGESDLVLRRGDVDKLLQSGNGDAALLYLALQRASGALEPEALASELGMSARQLDAAEKALGELGLLPRTAKPLAPARERTDFTPAEMASFLENPEFAGLRSQVEEKLDKHLTLADDRILAGLYHDLGFSADMLYLLVGHCIERARRSGGEGRRPTMHQIEKEGYYWARRGIYDQEQAAAYLKDYARRLEGTGPYMAALRLGDRQPVEGELKYLTAWMEQGFPPQTVAMAYDITVMRRGAMNWGYCNGVLKRWHEKGLHTPEQVEQGEQSAKSESRSARPAPRQSAKAGATAATDPGNSWAKKYARR